MSDIQVLGLIALGCVICICTCIHLNKQTAARLYMVMTDNDPDALKPKSPYSLSREMGSGGNWGYCITKDGKVMYSGGKATVFHSLEDGLKEVNNLEKLQGYKLTRL